ncbi:MAG: hypothetical protein JNM88_04200 [Chitinophagaceae bacterium]|nr:hypothetical protein [Chitinophagaceae bacterium]
MNELQRIDAFNTGEVPEKTKILITVTDVNNPSTVLQKTKDVIKPIASRGFTKKWPSDNEWKKILPAWFVESMVKKTPADRDKDPNLWHFESWLESMKNRAWVWWSSKIEDNTITIALETLNLPYVFEQVLYIFYSQGIPMKNITTWDDVYSG